MYGKNSNLDGGQELTKIQQQDYNNGSLLSRIIAAINSLSANTGAASVGKLPPPPPIDSIQVQGTRVGSTLTAPSEILHWTMAHNQPVKKNIRYFTEIDTSPSFTQPHVVDHGTSRTGILTLPTQDNEGKIQTYYMRSYAQYPGSDPIEPTVLGGLASPLQIRMTGASKTSLLSSTGSGTANPNGSQGGHGLGLVLERPVPGPKRNLSK